MDDHAITERARRQHGLITRSQAEALGATPSRIDRLLRAGAWQRLQPGTFLVGAAPRDWLAEVHAAVLCAGGDAVAGHRTAARLWGLVDRSGRIEVLVAHGRRIQVERVQVRRSRILPATHLGSVQGIPTASLERTLVDLSIGQDPAIVARWVDDAMRDHRLEVQATADVVEELSRPGRPRPRALMQALAQRSGGYDPGRSALESRALRAIAAAGLPAPVRQFPVRRPDGRWAYIDLAYPSKLAAIETDGWRWHGGRTSFDADRLRSNDLLRLGWSCIHFTSVMPDEHLITTLTSALGLTSGEDPRR